LLRYNPTNQSYKSYDGLATAQHLFLLAWINVLLAVSPDSLLIGTEGSGLLLMHTNSGNVERINFVKTKNRNLLNNASINAVI
jgi:hypothetical protein